MRSSFIKFSLFIALVLMAAAPGASAQATQHAVTTSWTAPAVVGGSGTLASYKIYRGTASGGPYINIGTVTAANTTFKDTTGVNATKYFYVVTSVDTASSESVFSGEASATAIGNPNPPSAVTATSN